MQYKSIPSLAGGLLFLAGLATATPVAQAVGTEPIFSVNPIPPCDRTVTIRATVTVTAPPSVTTIYLNGQTKTMTMTNTQVIEKIRFRKIVPPKPPKPRETNKTKDIDGLPHYNDRHYCKDGEALLQCKLLKEDKGKLGQCKFFDLLDLFHLLTNNANSTSYHKAFNPTVSLNLNGM